LLDHLERGTLTLDHLEVLTLDEADQMFDMGFLPDVRRILRLAPVQRQTMLFSATMPDAIRSLAREALREPQTIQIGRSAPVSTVTHAIYPVAEHLKTALLIELLRHTDTGSVLIFTRTKHRAQHLSDTLARMGYRATSLQGNLSQNRRQAALDGFRSGRYQILVATDIAARGIDVAHISHVINYDMPQTAEAYTHRIGRTGRAARTGDAFTLVTRSDTAMVRAIERLIGEPLKRETVPGFDYHAAAPAHDVRSDHAPRHHAMPRHYEPHPQDERDNRAPRRHDAQERRSEAAPRRRDVQEWRSDAAPNRHKPRSRDTSARSTRADRYDRTVSGRRRP